MSAKNYVCTICAQDFTRKSSGHRHNHNLHREQAKIVRTLEYIIGRVKGEYVPPANPLTYRRKNNISNSQDNHHFIDIAHDSTNPHRHEATLPDKDHRSTRQFYTETVLSNGTTNPVEVNKMQLGLTDGSTSVNKSKLDEFKLLCGRLLPYPNSEILLKKVEFDLIQYGGKESTLEKYLQPLRMMESVFQKPNAQISNTRAPLSEHRHLFDLPPDAKTKLETIKLALNNTRCFHPVTIYDLVEQ
jgi:hypothetical protein